MKYVVYVKGPTFGEAYGPFDSANAARLWAQIHFDLDEYEVLPLRKPHARDAGVNKS